LWNYRNIPTVLFGIILFLGCFILASCAGSNVTRDEYTSDAGEHYLGSEPAPAEHPREDGKHGEYFIRNGSVQLIVNDTRKIVQKIRDMADQAGGFVSSFSIYEYKENLFAATMTIRVPDHLFEDTMEQLEKMGKSTSRYHLEDVTAEYIDLEARLEVLNAQEERLQEILAMADTVEDVLIIEKELERVRSDIESKTAHFAHLRDRVRLSTIEINIKEETIVATGISPAPFENLGGRMLEGLVRSINFVLNVISSFLVLLAIMLPALIVVLALVLIIRAIIKKNKQRSEPPADS
jgi:hypothetical protein